MSREPPRESAGSPGSRRVTDRAQLVEYFRAACTPREKWRLGTEHELIGVSRAEADFGDAVAYYGDRGIRALFERMQERGWEIVLEGDNPVAMTRGEAQITLEPGAQMELSDRPVVHAEEFAANLGEFLAEVDAASEPLELDWLCVGFRPFQTLEEVPWVPKGRYAIMRDYLPTRGKLAYEMMKRTATVQVNIDYADADDARAKLRAIYDVTPILTALYANSPIVDERLSDYQSYRASVWRDTDPDRCGMLPFVYGEGDIFEAYTDWALDVPMFFIHRDGYIAAHEHTFRSFMNEGLACYCATMADWALHLSTLFPDARMKAYIEVRGCDAGSGPMTIALGPLCRGLFYDNDARAAASALTAGLDLAQREALYMDVARRGLGAQLPDGRKVLELARELVAIADAGLEREAPGERAYLDPVKEIAETGRTQADRVIELWNRTAGDRHKVVAELSHRRQV